MNDWFLKNLGDPILAHDQQEQIKQLLLSVYARSNRPTEMAAFIRHESEGRLHCELKIYFSPMFVSVAREVDAQPCEKPAPDGMSILVGAQESWGILFPDFTR